MKNAENVNFLQVDHEIKNVLQRKGVEIMASKKAWDKYVWTRKLFEEKPQEGYFIWVKEKLDDPITTCVTVASYEVKQKLRNLLVIEENIEAIANAVCNSKEANLCGGHKAKGRILLKKGSSLQYNHYHGWFDSDLVNTDYEFILEENSRLSYNYKNPSPPKELKIKTSVREMKSASSNLLFTIDGRNSEIYLDDKIFLEGDGSQSVLRLRLLGREKAKISALSSIEAFSKSKGHLDCQGLLVDKSGESEIKVTPELKCKSSEAQITHEASIGKISEEQLNYLRMRGLSEKEAIDLIITGFLNK